MQLDNRTLAYGLLAVAAFALLRIISKWRSFSFKRERIDWDAHFIQGLRKAGVDTFADHDVDFFFTAPTHEAAQGMANELRTEGYQVDILEAREISGQYSVHASRRMRLVVSDMQALTVRHNSLAASHGGQYDNWAVVTK